MTIPKEAVAAIESAAIEKCAKAASEACWKHVGEDAYSQGMDAGAIHQTKACVEAIRSIKPATTGTWQMVPELSDDEIVKAMTSAMCAESSHQMGEPAGCDDCDGLTGKSCEWEAMARAALSAYRNILAAKPQRT